MDGLWIGIGILNDASKGNRALPRERWVCNISGPSGKGDWYRPYSCTEGVFLPLLVVVSRPLHLSFVISKCWSPLSGFLAFITLASSSPTWFENASLPFLPYWCFTLRSRPTHQSSDENLGHLLGERQSSFLSHVPILRRHCVLSHRTAEPGPSEGLHVLRFGVSLNPQHHPIITVFCFPILHFSLML